MLPLFPGILLYCKQILTAMHFSVLLDMCSHRSDECYQKAWHEFERRYRKVILGHIRKHLTRFNEANNVGHAEEISSRVTKRLIDKDCHVLQIFKGRDNEGKLINYLKAICFFITINYMEEVFRSSGVPIDSVTIPISGEVIREEKDFQLYTKTFHDILRNSNKSTFHIERDIYILLMREIGCFKAKEVAQIPLLKFDQKKGEDRVNTIVDRLWDAVKKHKNEILRDFGESA